MLNSAVLSIFKSIEERKIEEIIVYLGDEQILQKYAKQINYTTQFEQLIDLYEKSKNGISISQQLDESSTAALSNSSLSPRISPDSLMGNGWGNGQSPKGEIHYFDHEDEDGIDYFR